MSFVFAAPEALAAAAADMAGIGSTLNAANVVAAVPTTGVLAAAADEVSTQVAALLSAHAQGYQQLSRQMMTAFHDQFVQALRASADVCNRRGQRRADHGERRECARKSVAGASTD